MGRKAKQALLDLDDPTEEQNEAADEPVSAPKPGKKKGKKGKAGAAAEGEQSSRHAFGSSSSSSRLLPAGGSVVYDMQQGCDVQLVCLQCISDMILSSCCSVDPVCHSKVSQRQIACQCA
jgi:hypothetical protein